MRESPIKLVASLTIDNSELSLRQNLTQLFMHNSATTTDQA